MLDAPVEVEEGPISPAYGAILGGVAAFVVVTVLESLSGMGGVPISQWNEAYSVWIWVPAVGAVVGFLYASSTLEFPKWVPLKLGAFFGFFLWIFSSVILKYLLPMPFKGISFSKESFFSCLFFGVCMGVLTEISARRAALQPKPVALD